jgi:hypothetical protein
LWRISLGRILIWRGLAITWLLLGRRILSVRRLRGIYSSSAHAHANSSIADTHDPEAGHRMAADIRPDKPYLFLLYQFNLRICESAEGRRGVSRGAKRGSKGRELFMARQRTRRRRQVVLSPMLLSWAGGAVLDKLVSTMFGWLMLVWWVGGNWEEALQPL